MTENAAFEIYREQDEKNKVSAMEFNHGVITYYFTDGTTEQWKKNWLGKFRRIKSREG